MELLTFPWLVEGFIEGSLLLMGGARLFGIEFAFFLAKNDIEIGLVWTIERNDLTPTWGVLD
jgi:hypothetical protein